MKHICHGVAQMDPQLYRQYVDAESGIVMRPSPFGTPFGDGVWRSSWFYSSLLVIRALDPDEFNNLSARHLVGVDDVERFLKYFVANSIGNRYWEMPNCRDQNFSRDQLIPLLLLLEVIAKFSPELKIYGQQILQSLLELEKTGRSLSNTHQGAIGRNIGYLIDVLCDKGRYGLNYRTPDLKLFLITCGGNIKCATGNRRGAYKELFSLSLKAHRLTGWVSSKGLDIADEYSVFNALGALSLLCLAWGVEDRDVRMWRSNFKVHSEEGWGPAFDIISGKEVTEDKILPWSLTQVVRAQDNDVIAAQRPTKIRDGVIRPVNLAVPDSWLVIDYVILRALQLVWKKNTNRNNKMIIDPEIEYHHRQGVSSVSLTAQKFDNEICITLNNKLIRFVHNMHEPSFTLNISDELKKGSNVLIISGINHWAHGQGNPGDIEVIVNVDDKRLHLAKSTPLNMRQGLFYQAVLLLEKA